MVTNMHWRKWFNFPYDMHIFDNPCISVPLNMVWSTLTSHFLFGSNGLGQDHRTDCTNNQQNLRAKGVLRISITQCTTVWLLVKNFMETVTVPPAGFTMYLLQVQSGWDCWYMFMPLTYALGDCGCNLRTIAPLTLRYKSCGRRWTGEIWNHNKTQIKNNI